MRLGEVISSPGGAAVSAAARGACSSGRAFLLSADEVIE
jgi:hypothetical protein